jgi:hypothetical protein
VRRARVRLWPYLALSNAGAPGWELLNVPATV